MPLDLKLLQNRVWLMDESSFQAASSRLSMFEGCYSMREVVKERRKRLEQATNIAASGAVRPGAKGDLTAVLPLFGPVDQHLSSALMKANGTALDDLSAALDALAADPRIKNIVIQADSGGGTVAGVEEISDKIFAMRKEKRIYAISDSFCASAAYWIASACETVVASPGSEVGSVGAYVVAFDESEAMANVGIKANLIRMPEFKAENLPFFPMSDEARAHLQAAVEEVYGKFVRAVARNRGTSAADVKANFGKGRMMSSARALEVGAVDRVMSMEDLLLKLTGAQMEGVGVQRKRAEQLEAKPAQPSAEVLRARRDRERLSGART